MSLLRIVKVQTPALRLPIRWRGEPRELRFGAHNFVALLDETGRTLREFHGIARGPAGAQLRVFGGIVPFAEEYIWGETFHGRTGFYDESFPQGDLVVGEADELRAKLDAAAALQAAVNARSIRYPWPATLGSNSNAYYGTLIAAMGLEDVRVKGQLWAPSARRLLLRREELALLRPD